MSEQPGNIVVTAPGRKPRRLITQIAAEGPDASGRYKWAVFAGFQMPTAYEPYRLRWDFRLQKPGELYIDFLPPPSAPRNGLRVLLLVEPNVISKIRWEAISAARDFDYVLTFDSWVRWFTRNSVLFPFGTAWVKQPAAQRVFAVSSVFGRRRVTVMQRKRHKLWNMRSQFKVPTRLYLSSDRNELITDPNYPWILGAEKQPMFESQFHIAIENFIQRHYFSEKLIDCFMTETVPIYIGCPNIGDYFDTRGILRARNVEEVVRIVNSLTPQTYESMLPAIRENRRRANYWVDFEKRIRAKLRQLCRANQPLLAGRR